jgi:hypothetical protein
MTPNEIDKIVSKLTAQSRTQEEIRNTVARLRGQMAPKDEKAAGPVFVDFNVDPSGTKNETKKP